MNSSLTAQDIASTDKKYLWHPFTQMRAWEAEEPLIIASGNGLRLKDTDGREYWDANSSLWVNIHGHNRPEINQAIVDQLSSIAHSTLLGLTHAPAALLAERLVQVAPPGLTKVFYSDSGATAVEIALKMAFQYQSLSGHPERTRFIALQNSYHGDTIGAVSVGGIDLFHGIFRRLLFPVDFAPCPAHFPDAEQAANNLEALLNERKGEVAGIIVEPLIQGAAGMLLSPPGFLKRVRELCDQHDLLLIVDEVATGFGRTGTLFACEQEDVSPDLMCLAKGITGGYLPLAATLATDRIYEAFLGEYQELKTFFHGHSYTGNELACAAALASLNIFEDDDVMTGLSAKITCVRELLKQTAALPHVREVRQCGLMVGIELQQAADIPYPFAEAMGAQVCRHARHLGLITRPLGDVVVFLPPLAATEADLIEMLKIIHESICAVTDVEL